MYYYSFILKIFRLAISINISFVYVSLNKLCGSILFFENDTIGLSGLLFAVYLFLLFIVFLVCFINKSKDLNENKSVRLVLRFTSHLFGVITIYSFLILMILILKDFHPLYISSDTPKIYLIIYISSLLTLGLYFFLFIFNTLPKMPMISSFLSYIYYLPTYTLCFQIFSFCLKYLSI